MGIIAVPAECFMEQPFGAEYHRDERLHLWKPGMDEILWS